MIENPVRSPIVPPIADNWSTNFAYVSIVILSNVGVSNLIMINLNSSSFSMSVIVVGKRYWLLYFLYSSARVLKYSFNSISSDKSVLMKLETYDPSHFDKHCSFSILMLLHHYIFQDLQIEKLIKIFVPYAFHLFKVTHRFLLNQFVY